MDLMGSDAVQGEEALRKMWKESLKDCNCSAARITYDDFVLIMKGQTRDFETDAEGMKKSDSGQKLNGAWVHAVNKVDEKRNSNPKLEGLSKSEQINSTNGFAQHFESDAAGLDLDSPLSMDEDDGVPGTSPFLGTPIRESHIKSKTPQSIADELMIESSSTAYSENGLDRLPPLPKPSVIHKRGKSRSFDERDMNTHFDIDSRRALALPEHDPEMKKNYANNNKMSALQVNRQLYRSHRQMRLSVIDACKRFEEQQERRARGVLLAEKNRNTVGGFAGLVMRRVENKTVSSEEVKNLLEKNRKEQQALMEKANKRSGGRRSRRKKTVSDLSTMMGSISSEEMTKAVAKKPMIPPVIETKPLEHSDDTNFRQATVPGQFRKVKDPFGSQGKYAAIMSKN